MQCWALMQWQGWWVVFCSKNGNDWSRGMLLSRMCSCQPLCFRVVLGCSWCAHQSRLAKFVDKLAVLPCYGKMQTPLATYKVVIQGPSRVSLLLLMLHYCTCLQQQGVCAVSLCSDSTTCSVCVFQMRVLGNEWSWQRTSVLLLVAPGCPPVLAGVQLIARCPGQARSSHL